MLQVKDKAGAGGGEWGRGEEERFLAGALFGIAGKSARCAMLLWSLAAASAFSQV